MKPFIIFILIFIFIPGSPAAERPNILIILCDDLGYGDVRCNNPGSKIPTPHIDALAAQGMRFTDAHTTSSVCTPTRYSLLTGRYNWRSKLQKGVLGGLSPRLIEPGRATIASVLHEQGYHTACIGKWHLGLDWVKQANKDVAELDIEKPEQSWNVDFSKPFTGGPLALGFDSYFGIAASLDMPPFTYLENDRCAVVPTTEKKWVRKGPAAADFEAVDVLPMLTRKAISYITERAAKPEQPFFLYLPLASPHTPLVPNDEWRGKSGIGDYADFVMQTNAAIGSVMEAIEKAGIAEKTLVLFTSDNGCSPAAGIDKLRASGHEPNAPLRGTKADIWDGGHRVPFIVRWPGKVKPGTTSDQLVSLVDLMATSAELSGAKLASNIGEDSVSFLPVLAGTATAPMREALVHHSIDGAFAIRQGEWKLALCPGSGGWSAPRDPAARKQGLPETQLYRIGAGDIAETKNVAAENPDVVERLTKLLERYVSEGRSTPGDPQRNAVAVKIRKAP
jgi:arylsulfatase A